MFEDLPETNPLKNARKPRAIASAMVIQVILVATIILVQMSVPHRFGGFQLISGTSAAPPPPLGQPSPQRARELHPKPVQKVQPQSTVPQPEPPKPEETPSGEAGGQIEGVEGGLRGGVPGGTGEAVRVGGNVREPQLIKLVKPEYPREAIHARVEGVVVLEATINEKGNVIDVKVLSGPPELIPAAIKAVQEWKYEPTFINGQAVPVILTANVKFSLRENLK
jgi:periplasmic protein TonB